MSNEEHMEWLQKIKDKAKSSKNSDPAKILMVQIMLSILMYLENEKETLSRETIQKEIEKL
jgi:hypothetical protein